MNKRLIFWLKITLTLAIAVIVGWKFYDAWQKVADRRLAFNWPFAPIAIIGFSGSMLTSAAVWRFLSRQMGDRGPAVPLLASYTYSQMGKYIPGKVVLLLMRIERAGRFGMTADVCTLSTLLENALYMISGGLVGMLAIVRIAGEINAAVRPFLWPVTIAAILVMMTACYPPVFYGLVNRLLRKMKKPEVPREEALGAGTLAIAVAAFTPCWLFGGLALWASMRFIEPPIAPPIQGIDAWWLAGAFALSVIIGMASLLPGGAGIREAVLGAAAVLAYTGQGIPQNDAVVLAGAVAILQRLFQLTVEILLGLLGMALTTRARAAPAAKPAERAP